MSIDNNGIKVYTILVEFNVRTGQPTGRTKPNVPADPNYIAPVEDLTMCPLPGTPIVLTQNITVSIASGFAATIKLLYNLSELDQTTSGTWTVAQRTYDGIIFSLTTTPVPYYVEVIYANGTTKTVKNQGTSDIYIPGPFPAITGLIIASNGGDYNNDFNNDYLLNKF